VVGCEPLTNIIRHNGRLRSRLLPSSWPPTLGTGQQRFQWTRGPGVFCVVAGVLGHAIYVATGASYATFAGAAHFSLIRSAWHRLISALTDAGRHDPSVDGSGRG
jgi:hypothetical protein